MDSSGVLAGTPAKLTGAQPSSVAND